MKTRFFWSCLCPQPKPHESESEEEEEGECPLKSLSYEVSVEGWVAQVKVEQEYKNEEEKSVEGVYEFPCDPKAAITDVVMKIGNRVVKSQVMESGDARDTYEDGIAMGSKALLVERKKNKDDVYRITVGAIPSNEKVTVALTYTVELKMLPSREGELIIPLTTMPRYGEPAKKGEAPLPPRTRRSQQPYTAVIRCSALDSSVAGFYSPSHDVSDLTVPQEFTPDRDVAICIKNVDDGPIRVTASTDTTVPGDMHHALAIPIKPKYPSEEAKKSFRRTPNTEVVILLDCSGSMSGEPINSCERVARFFIQSLPAGCLFNIVKFGTTFNTLFESPMPLQADTLLKAKEYVNGLKADLRGTNLLSPLKALYGKSPRAGCSRQFLVITDGAVKNTSEVLKLAALKTRSTRVFSVGLGSACSKMLVEGLARFGNGTATYVSDTAGMTSAIMKVVKQMTRPAITDCSLKSTVLGFKLTTKTVPPVFYDTSLIAYGFAPAEWSPSLLAGAASTPQKIVIEGEKRSCLLEAEDGFLTLSQGDTQSILNTTCPVLLDEKAGKVKFTTTADKTIVVKSPKETLYEIALLLNRYGVKNTLLQDVTVGAHKFSLGLEKGAVRLFVSRSKARAPSVIKSIECDRKKMQLSLLPDATVKTPIVVKVTDEALLLTLGDLADAAFIPHSLPSTNGAIINFVYNSDGHHRVTPCLGGSGKGASHVHKMASFKLIKQLEDAELLEDDTQNKKQLIETSIASGIPCKYTSCVAVDEDGDADAAQGAMATRRVPISEPAGWANERSTFKFGAKQKKKMSKGTRGAMRVSSVLMAKTAVPTMLSTRAMSMSSPPVSMPQSRLSMQMQQDLFSIDDTMAAMPRSRNRRKRSSTESSPERRERDKRRGKGCAIEQQIRKKDMECVDVMSSECEEDEALQLDALSIPATTSIVEQRVKQGLDEILYMQAFDGSWAVSEMLVQLINTTTEDVKAEASARSLPTVVWMTVLVMQYLMRNFFEHKDEWCLIYDKAENYIRDAGHGDTLDTIAA